MRWRGFGVLRSLAAIVIVGAAAFALQPRAAMLSMPWIAVGLEAWGRDFHVLRLGLAQQRGHDVVVVMLQQQRAIFVGDRAILPGDLPPAVVTANVGTMLLPLWITLAAALAWPGRWVERLVRFAVALPLAAGVVWIDTPAVLVALALRPIVEARDSSAHSPILAWQTFLVGGGQVVLALLAAVLAVAMAEGLLGLLGHLGRAGRRQPSSGSASNSPKGAFHRH